MTSAVEVDVKKAQSYLLAGNLSGAERIYRNILKANSNNIDANIGIASIALNVKNFKVAESYLQHALNLDEDRVDIAKTLLETKIVLKKLHEAKNITSSRVDLAPQYKVFIECVINQLEKLDTTSIELPKIIHVELVNLFRLNLFSEVERICNFLLRIFPNNFLLYELLSIVCLNLNKSKLAEAYCKKALEVYPDSTNNINNLANIYIQTGRHLEALPLLKTCIDKDSNHTSARTNLGLVHLKLGNIMEAQSQFLEVLRNDPHNVKALYNLGTLYLKASKFREALSLFNKCLSVDLDHFRAANNAANCCKNLGDYEKSIKLYHKCLTINPNYLDALNNLGNVYADLGETEKAIGSYCEAIKKKPDYIAAHRHLSLLRKCEGADDEFYKILKGISTDTLSLSDNVKLHFSIAKYEDDQHKFEDAFKHYKLGNQLRAQEIRYDSKHDTELFARLNALDVNTIEAIDTSKYTTTPIFILGMPRSGTTLVEQIISSHSQVFGAGELTFIEDGLKDLSEPVTTDYCHELGYEYIKYLNDISNGHQYVVDKMPHNFRYIPYLIKLFPSAKIINVKRDPRAVIWSNFIQLFSTTALGYSTDLTTMIDYVNNYNELMKKWKLMFSDNILALHYEKLTVEPDNLITVLLDFVGLEHESSCFSPHLNKRVVKTASQHQVRRKIYSKSSEKWKSYERFLEPYFMGLNLD